MIVFWTLAVLMLAAAVGLLVRPLVAKQADTESADRNALNISIFKDRLAELERDLAEDNISRDQYEQACHELERDLLVNTEQGEPERVQPNDGRWAAPVMVLLLPVLALGIYLQLGSLELVDSGDAAAERHQQGDAPTADDMRDMVAKLQERLREQPDNVDGWILLARSLVTLQRYDEAADALQQARAVGGEDPALLAEHAEIIAMERGGDMSGEPMELVMRSLGQDPEQPHALWLAGVGAQQQEDFAKAVDFWTRLLEVVPEGSEAAEMVQANIEQARAAMSDASAGAAASEGVRLEVGVSLSPEIASRAAPEDPVFIFARSGGGEMPLAVARKTVKDLPATVVLDDSDATPMEGGKLSDYSEVVVVARISKSGNASATSGDLEGSKRASTTAGEPVELVIDSVVP